MSGDPEPPAASGSLLLLAWLHAVYGPAAPDLLRRKPDELEWLEAERAAESAGGDLDTPN